MSWLAGLSFAELVAVIVVSIEVVIVGLTLLVLIVLRRGAITREQKIDQARQQMSELLPQLDGPQGAQALAKTTAVVKGLPTDSARRLLTEFAEFMTIDSVGPLTTIFVETGLTETNGQLSAGKSWQLMRAIREARALNDPGDVLSGLVQHVQPDVRIAAFEALCALGRADETMSMLREIVSDGRLIRTRVIDSLAASEPLPVAHLSELSQAEDALLRFVCVGALGRAGRRDALDVIIGGVTDSDIEVRIEALRSLKELADGSALPACLSALKDEFWEVRSAAVGTCAELGGEGAAEEISKLLSDNAEWVRHNASIALGKCGPTGMAYLRQAAANGNENASSALAALRLATEGE